MCETEKSRTNSRFGARATRRMELAFTVMEKMCVEQVWGWGRYLRVGFWSCESEGPITYPSGHGQFELRT